jgi:hypothetical protein
MQTNRVYAKLEFIQMTLTPTLNKPRNHLFSEITRPQKMAIFKVIR